MQRTKALLALALLFAPTLFAGCTNADESRAPHDVIQAVADTRAMTWARGNYWSYAATFHQEKTYHIALVVHDARDDGFRLGSNVSSGFFGLPFSGNVTRGLNPEIGGEVWPMFEFPLNDGKTWEYSMFGYDATTTAYAAVIDVPGVGEVAGYRFEATAYGQVFARYDYAPVVGWFTRLELIEPSDRTQVLDVRMTGFGPAWGRDYYVERVIRAMTITYPTSLPGEVEVVIPEGYERVHATLTARATAGVADARLVDAQGRTLAEARAVAKGIVSDRATADTGGLRWSLAHTGSGAATIYVEVTGVRAQPAMGQPESALAPSEEASAPPLAVADVRRATGRL